MRPVRIALLIAALGTAQAQAGVFDDDEARRQITDLKIKTEARFDQQAKGQLDLAGQIQRQAEEIARLRGQLETLNYELETAKKRQQDFYLDLDTRLRKFEAPGSANATVDPAAGGNPVKADPAREGQEYEAALNQFKAAKYKEAAVAFAGFVQKYPDSSLAPNAQYWLGNAWYAQRDCKRAIEAQTLVTTKYADSPKAPDAWLAIATCQQELGNPAGAKRSLETVLGKYPNTPAAESAQQRLKKK
ncbi:tol-pal system protein YbgF [Dechloromonas sp. TW-R-39-2]|uniref:tol-pal system protein YbgF n=1 Tax=Dechloromonas sp. TW-R-39-2 TaxID=2654218 RepID=UPI00193DF1ED|nr:tol-pal system protein YbgF [Dechloromonas sp. TW-R-39-2]QRM18091.1 tol-pal system protein YbgF [Dechloromonas sp. TW-R-39-2]